ncbi:hypothetical protein [Aureibacter tunicatorum]|uniref:Uncharacterized protein n=1 Tax=Aureibacter tunicatorum TaxID=866807 RepID=A0AAE4BS19_9BACT|nr:hypothetical protein [Aureibacter tunicatorum]MDR6238420.1 hypothetical protein [Aureibacter tunicatorum]BDD03452.1 hypothetical protein AUTU_09350 [Aureibacter tunicatorum]
MENFARYRLYLLLPVLAIISSCRDTYRLDAQIPITEVILKMSPNYENLLSDSLPVSYVVIGHGVDSLNLNDDTMIRVPVKYDESSNEYIGELFTPTGASYFTHAMLTDSNGLILAFVPHWSLPVAEEVIRPMLIPIRRSINRVYQESMEVVPNLVDANGQYLTGVMDMLQLGVISFYSLSFDDKKGEWVMESGRLKITISDSGKLLYDSNIAKIATFFFPKNERLKIEFTPSDPNLAVKEALLRRNGQEVLIDYNGNLNQRFMHDDYIRFNLETK